MLSFKDFLKEEKDIADFKVICFYKTTVDPSYLYNLVPDVRSKLSGIKYNVSIDVSNPSNIQFYFNDLDFSDFSNEDYLLGIVQSCIDAVEEEINFDVQYTASSLILLKVPKQQVIYNDIDNIFIGEFPSKANKEKFINLTNIDKNLICKKVFINATSISNGVLSLLKAKFIVEFMGNKPEWAIIVQKHLKGDRNILKCQRELIQNGFKDYAKL